MSLLISGLTSNAQLTLTKAANEPVVGDIKNIKGFDTVAVFPKNTGTGQIWNFSNLVSNSFTETTTYTTVAASPSPALFTNANIAAHRTTEWEFYKSNASTFDYAGMIFQNGDIVNFSNLGTEYSWPISYGSTYTDTFTATQTSGTMTINWVGSIYYSAVGSGTVILPGGGTFNNCLLVISTVSVLMTAGSFTQSMVMNDYEFFSSGYKFPIVYNQYQTITSGTTVTKQVSIELNSAALPVGIKENTISSNAGIIVYPNPANTELNITLSNSMDNYSVVLSDMSGKTLVEKTNIKSLDVSNIQKGIYILTVNGKNFNARKTVVITH